MRHLILTALLFYIAQSSIAQTLETRIFKPLYFGGDVYETHADSTFTFTNMVILLHGRDTLYCDKMVQKNKRIDFYNARLVAPDGMILQAAHMTMGDTILYGPKAISTDKLKQKHPPMH